MRAIGADMRSLAGLPKAWRRLSCTALLVALSSGCSVTPPDEGRPDVPMPPILGADSVAIGLVAFRCGSYVNAVPNVEGWAVLDIALRQPGIEPPTEPAPEAVAPLVARGAEIMHSFAFPMVRAVVPLDALSDLWPETVAWARMVPYSDRFDVPAAVLFNGGNETEWRALVTELGGEVGLVFEEYRNLFAILPDASAPDLRAHPTVGVVELNGQFCEL